jgi:hypothetical protein
LEYHLGRGIFPDNKLTAANSHIISRGGQFLDLGRSDLAIVSGSDVLDAIRDGVGADASVIEVTSLEVCEEAVALELVSPRLSEEVRVGDVIRAGLRIDHSFLGAHATTIKTFVLRLLCANGLTHRDCQGQMRGPRTRRIDASHPRATEMQLDQIRKLTSQTWERLQEKLDAIRRLSSERVDAATLLTQFVGRSRLHSRRLTELLLDGWAVEGSDPTAFGVLNALTRVATHSAVLSIRQRRMLAQLAGVFANRHTHVCPRCFSILRDDGTDDPSET